MPRSCGFTTPNTLIMFDFWNQKHVLQSLTDSLVFKTWTRLILCKLKCYILFRVEKLRKKMKWKKLYTSLSHNKDAINTYTFLGSRLKVENMKRFISLQRRLFSMRLISTKLLHQVLEVSCSTWIFNPRSGIMKVNIIIQLYSLSLLSSFPFQCLFIILVGFVFFHIFYHKICHSEMKANVFDILTCAYTGKFLPW